MGKPGLLCVESVGVLSSCLFGNRFLLQNCGENARTAREPLWLQSCALCSPDHCFCRAKWASKIRPPKVCMFIVKIVCAFRKSLKNACNIQRTVLRKAFLSFSLRFCSTCKMHYKTRLKIKNPTSEGYFLHTSRAKSSVSKINFEKTTVVRTRVQSMGATCPFLCSFIVFFWCLLGVGGVLGGPTSIKDYT